ncbi:MAG: M16 family metallopeptidase [Planctomycetota bacterium]
MAAASFAGFERTELHGVPVLYDCDPRPKTLRVLLLARRPLDSAKSVAARSLLPSLLLHGTRRHPQRPKIARRMEELYGAVAVPSIGKSGDDQVFRACLDSVAGRFLPGRPKQVEDGCAFLAELCFEPALDGDGFPAAIFERERRQALDQVRTRIDDRGAYAREEAVARACYGEPMAIYDFGSESALAGLDRTAPERARADILERGSLCVVASGAFEVEELLAGVDRLLQQLPTRRPAESHRTMHPRPRSARREIERVDLQQTKLVVLARFPRADLPELWVGRRLFLAMLGGGPQSRLFKEVREKRSLAYYASAGAERHKGLIVVQVGCDEAKLGAVEEEIERQFGQLARGEFDDRELEVARAQILHGLDTIEDSPATRCSFVAEQWALGVDWTVERLRAAYRAADRELVVNAAAGIWHDYTFVLAPTGSPTAVMGGAHA